jgi:hypothetical protein
LSKNLIYKSKKVSIYFKATVMTVLLLFLGILILCLISFFSISNDDKEAYKKLVQSRNSAHAKLKMSPYTAKQQRKGMQKDILFTQGEDRLQLSLTSEKSTLVLDWQENGMQIIEKMQNVKCVMQEELFYVLDDGREVIKQANGKLILRHGKPSDPLAWVNSDTDGLKPMQHLRCMEASDATYYYKSDLVVAEQVSIYRFTLPGHKLIASPEGKPTMLGNAKNAEFSLAGKELNFTAQNLKVVFYEECNPL